jgi:DNA-binding Lrp family transcriptional regulator
MNERNLWEEIKEGAREGFEVLKEEMVKLTQELEKQGKIIKKKMDLSAIQRKVHLSFSQLGSRLYELFEEGKQGAIVNDPEILKIISDIKDYKAEVEAIEDEIDRIREEGAEKSKSDAEKPGETTTGRKKKG